MCSVGWAQRGDHLAIGTNKGKVQVVSWSFVVDPVIATILAEIEGNVGVLLRLATLAILYLFQTCLLLLCTNILNALLLLFF